jgi:hypothetical protein
MRPDEETVMQTTRILITLAIVAMLSTACQIADEFEPNNVPASATPIADPPGLTDDGRVVSGLLFPGDVDYWKLELASDSFLTVSLEGPDRGDFTDTLVGIFDDDGNLLISNDDGGAGFMSRISLLVASGGYYHIAVTGFGDDDFDGSGHDQMVIYRLIAAAASVVTEQDAGGDNDDPDTPQLLPVAPGKATLVTGMLSPSDIDHYAFEVAPGQTANAAVYDGEGGGQNDSILEILDGTDAVVASDDDSGPGLLSNVEYVPGAGGGGVYRVALSGFTGQENFTYQLVVARD